MNVSETLKGPGDQTLISTPTYCLLEGKVYPEEMENTVQASF